MKKRGLLLVMCIMLLLVTACGKTPQEQLKEVLTNETKCESFKVSLKADLKIEQDGMNVDVNLPISVAYANKIAKLELGENPFVGKLDFYVDNTKVYMSSKLYDNMLGMESDKEYYIVEDIEESEEDEEESLNFDDLKIDLSKEEIEGLIDSFGEDNITLVSEDKDIKEYKLTYTKSVIDYVLGLEEFKDLKAQVDESGIKFDNISYSMNISVNTKTDAFIKASLNVADLLKEIVKISGEEMTEEDKEMLDAIKKFDITVELSDCNTATVTIPNEIKDNAITSEEYNEILNENMADDYEDSDI